MGNFKYIFSYAAIYLNIYAMIYSYNTTLNKEIKMNFFNLFIVGIVTLFIFLANDLVNPILRLMIAICSVMLGYGVIFRENIFFIIFKTLIIFLVLHLCDSIIAIVYVFFPLEENIELIDKISYFRALNTVLESLLLILIFLIKPFVKVIKILIGYFNKAVNFTFLIVALFACIVFLVLSYINAFKLNIEIFLLCMLLMFFFILLCGIMIFQYFKNKHSEKEQESLLELMNEYEIILDKDRINRHEMLNNLIVLKSFSDKSTKEYEDLLNEIINIYQDNKSKLYTNLYKLPSGIKGVIYYKMATIKQLNINLNLLISTDAEDKFERLNKKLYYKVCKILGIVLDNAIEATKVTEEKILLIDIYLDEDYYVIYVENDFINAVDLNNIYNKGVSSKGNNRGYGLYVVNKIVKDTNNIIFEQTINKNKFTTIIKIKNPSD